MNPITFNVVLTATGVSHCLCLADGSPDEWRQLMDVNVVALCLCTKEAVASMQRRSVQDGHIFNLSRSVQSTLENFCL
jgi:NAD(P)-dependent dehydrogenase (short-subunit alcohol dehydrogenase family)